MTQTIVIPDIHGRLTTLLQVLAHYPDANYIFLGDLIDRGPDSKAVVRKVINLIQEGRAQMVFGNHEMMAMDALVNPHQNYANWFQNGGWSTMTSYDTEREFAADLSLLLSLAKPYLIVGQTLYSHAAPPLLLGENIIGEYHIWNRPSLPNFDLPEGCDFSVHGHTPMNNPYVDADEGIAYIDLGMRRLAVLSHDTRKVLGVYHNRDKISELGIMEMSEAVKSGKYLYYKEHLRVLEDIQDSDAEMDARLDHLLGTE